MKEYLYKIRLVLAIIVLSAGTAGILGIFYPVRIFDIQIVPFLERLFVDFSAGALVSALIVILLSLIFGRIFCSLCCPLGILQELFSLITKKDCGKRQKLPFKYFIASVSIGIMIGGTALVIRYIDPYALFSSSLTLKTVSVITVILICASALLYGRFFCVNICPAGTILGLLSKFSIFKMYIDKNECLSCSMCEKSCQTGCININEQEIDNENCVKCLKCMQVCPKGAVNYGIKPLPEVKFSKKRRELLVSGAVLLCLGASIKAGIKLSKNTAEKIKRVIIPPYAQSPERLLNKCLNCNLCVNACPNKIIKKSDENFGAVHIEYGGKGFCDYKCNKCSETCPSGAIKRITPEQKQNIRIAVAVINKDNCDKCGSCIPLCPKGAISSDEHGCAVLDGSKCIGCGLCKSTCGHNAIEIYGVNEQKIV